MSPPEGRYVVHWNPESDRHEVVWQGQGFRLPAPEDYFRYDDAKQCADHMNASLHPNSPKEQTPND